MDQQFLQMHNGPSFDEKNPATRILKMGQIEKV